MTTRMMFSLVAALLCAASLEASAATLRDPTQPPLAPVAAPTVAAPAPLRVEAIFRHGDQLSAIVAGKLVRRGDRVGTAIIQEITGDSVRYLRGGRSAVARLKQSKLNVRRTNAPVEEET